jgi:hypothetical protein
VTAVDMTNLLRQLYAMRLLLDGVIGELEPLAPEDEAGAGTKKIEACPHPADRQVDASVMGGPPMVLCLACGAQRVGSAPAR